MTWPTVELAEIADVLRGVTYKREQARESPEDGHLPLLRATNIGTALEIEEGLVYVPESVVRDAQRLQVDDIVLASSSGSISVVGKSARLTHEWRGTFGAFCAVLRAKPGVFPAYLGHYIQSDEVRKRWSNAARGTNINNLKRGDLTNTPVPLPSLDEQRRTVDLLEGHLSRLEAAGNYLSASRRRLDGLERSVLDAHFGGLDVPLSDLIEDISAGKSFGGANAPAPNGEWGIIKVSAMTWGEFDPTKNKAVTSAERVDPRFEIREGDLLVSRAKTSEYVGASVLVRHVRPRLLLSDKSLRVTPRAEVESEWLWRALQAPSARRQISALATGTKDSMRNISQAALKRILLPNVSNEEQAAALKAFNEVADAIVLLRREVEAGSHRLEALRRSLLGAAFSGRLTGASSEPSAAKEMINA